MMVIKTQKPLFVFILGISSLFITEIISFAGQSSRETSKETQRLLYEDYTGKGLDCFRKGLLEEAKDFFWEAINAFPENPGGYVNLGIIYIEENDLKSAMGVFSQAKNLVTDDYDQKEIFFHNFGLCFFKQEKYQEAVDCFQKALEAYPDFGEARYYLGRSFYELGQKERAFMNIFVSLGIFEKENKPGYKNKAKQFLENLCKNAEIETQILADVFLEEGSKYFANKDPGLPGYIEHVLVDYQKKDGDGKMVLHDWAGPQSKDAVTFIIKGGKVSGWLKEGNPVDAHPDAEGSNF